MNDELPIILLYTNSHDDYSDIIAFFSQYKFKIIIGDNKTIDNKIRENEYDFCILDYYGNPVNKDLQLVYKVCEISRKIPIIFMTNFKNFKNTVDMYNYCIEAYVKGVNEFITKPFNLEVLRYKILSYLKMIDLKYQQEEKIYHIGRKFELNTALSKLQYENYVVKLSPKEISILTLFVKNKNSVISKTRLFEYLNTKYDYYTQRSLDVTMTHLRKCFSIDKDIEIVTLPRKGYIFKVKEEEDIEEKKY